MKAEGSELATVISHFDAVEGGLRAANAFLNSEVFGSDGLAEVTRAARSAERLLAGVLMSIGRQASRLEAAGVGPAAVDVLSDGDSVSTAQVRQERERVRVAASFPAVGAALADGTARPANVDVLARMTARMTDEEVAVLADQDSLLAAKAGTLAEESFRKTAQRRRDRIRGDAGVTAAEQAKTDAFARVSPSRDKSSFRIAGLLEGQRGGLIQAAMKHETSALARSDEPLLKGLDLNQLSAEALYRLIMRGSAEGTDAGEPQPTVVLNVLVDRDTLESGPHDGSIVETDDGVAVCPEQLGYMACNSILRRLDVLPDGTVHASHTGRTATQAQRAVLRSLYPVCPLSGVPWSQIEVHHTVHFEQSKRTVLSELVPISRWWHHRIHHAGWEITLDEDRTLRLYRPDGTLDRTVAPPVVATRREFEQAA